jgi:lipopolysaccharide/colanic/teichoic acid biosynthesis glycosyltransferase
VARRALDVLASAVGLVLLSPVFVVVALAIFATSPGPVFFRQVRIGRNGGPFRMYKFRSMCVDAEALGGQLTVSGDPRITRVGAFLRASKIDELPQLINVLVGEMSLVGPRPEVPRYLTLYTPEQRRVLEVRPGITDPASVLYRDEPAVLARAADPERAYVEEVLPHKLAINLAYLERRSLASDVGVILTTLWRLLRRRDG